MCWENRTSDNIYWANWDYTYPPLYSSFYTWLMLLLLIEVSIVWLSLSLKISISLLLNEILWSELNMDIAYTISKWLSLLFERTKLTNFGNLAWNREKVSLVAGIFYTWFLSRSKIDRH